MATIAVPCGSSGPGHGGCASELSLDEALGLMAGAGESTNSTIEEVASPVIDGVVRFDSRED
jgi:hypothetical protein